MDSSVSLAWRRAGRNVGAVNCTVDPGEDDDLGDRYEYERPSSVVVLHQVQPVGTRLSTFTASQQSRVYCRHLFLAGGISDSPPPKKNLQSPPKNGCQIASCKSFFRGEQCITNVSRVTNISKTFTHYGGENELA